MNNFEYERMVKVAGLFGRRISDADMLGFSHTGSPHMTEAYIERLSVGPGGLAARMLGGAGLGAGIGAGAAHLLKRGRGLGAGIGAGVGLLAGGLASLPRTNVYNPETGGKLRGRARKTALGIRAAADPDRFPESGGFNVLDQGLDLPGTANDTDFGWIADLDSQF